LIPLTFFFFGIGENQKVLFIFLACVAFVVSDTSNSIRNVSQAYIDTAYTLGAGRRQVIMKVLVPLAMPSIFESLRLLFGLAFGYIMLAETIKFGNEAGGLGNLISLSQRQGPRTHIILIILIIPVVALAIDQLLFWIQRQLFPFRHGGAGWLQRAWTMLMHQWENVKSIMFQTRPPFDQVVREYEIEQAAGKRPKYGAGAIANPASNKEWRP
jgi:ABC-type nitrate/sulfonate/bicarbonate transport system permease component